MTFALLKKLSLPALCMACLFLSACNLGYDLGDSDTDGDTDSSAAFHGPSENAAWELELGDTDSFELTKRASPSELSEYSLLGTYSDLGSGYKELTITSNLPADITSNTLVALEMDDEAIILFPFEAGSSDLIALIPLSDDISEQCPSNDVTGNWLRFDSTEDTSSESNAFIGEIRYSVNSDTIRLITGFALDDEFSGQTNEISLADANCENGLSELDSGNQYFSENTLVAEEDGADTYGRIFSLPALTVSSLTAFDGDYVGYMFKLSEVADTSFASANCTSGNCDITLKNDHTDTSSSTETYTLEFDEDSLNPSSVGLVQGTIASVSNTSNTGNLLCTINTDLTPSNTGTTKVIACAAQAPDENTSIISFFFVATSS